MKKKIIVIFICMLLITTVVVSATGIIIKSPTKNEKSDIENSISEQKPVKSKSTKTDFLSISATAFIPGKNTITVQHSGFAFWGNGTYFAPVYLPDNATVTRLSFSSSDNSQTENGILFLWRSPRAHSASEMARVMTTGSDGYRVFDTDEIFGPEIKNDEYCYYLRLELHDHISCAGVLIEYKLECEANSANYNRYSNGHEPHMPFVD